MDTGTREIHRPNASRLGFAVLILIILACGTIMRRTDTIDYTVTHRNLAWGIGTLALFIIVSSTGMFMPKIVPLMFAVFLVSLVTVIWAINKGEAFYETVNAFVATVFLYTASIEIRGRINALVKIIVMLSIGLSLFGIYEYYLHPGPAWASARIGTMGNKNLCASAHVLLIPFCLYALRYKGWKIISVIATLAALFVIFTLRTRTACLAVFVIAIVFALNNKQYFLYALTLLPLIMGLTLINKESPIFNTSSINQRMDLWKQTLNMSKDHPFGVGAGNWAVRMPLYARNFSDVSRGLGFKSQQWGKAHNDFLEYFSEIGIIGGVLYAGIFVLGIYYAVRKRCILYSELVVFVVISCFSFPAQRVFHKVIILTALAIIVSKCKIRKLNLRPGTLYLCNILILAGLSFSIYVYGVRHITEKKMYIVHRAKAGNDWNGVLYYTSNISTFATLDYYNTPILSYRGLAYSKNGNHTLALKSHLDAFWQHPYHIYPLVNIPVCMTNLGRLQEACAWYEKILPMFPGYDEIGKRYVDTYMRMRNEQHTIRRR